MAKTLIVHVLYGDEDALREVMKRCVEDSISFHYTGEFLYSNTDWAPFLRLSCPDLIDRVRVCVERWADICMGFEGSENDTVLTIRENGNSIGDIQIKPCHTLAITKVLSLLCRLAAAHGVNVQFGKF